MNSLPESELKSDTGRVFTNDPGIKHNGIEEIPPTLSRDDTQRIQEIAFQAVFADLIPLTNDRKGSV